MVPKITYTLAEKIHPDAADALAQFSPTLQQLLFSRNVLKPATAEAFISPDYESSLHNPFAMHDMEKAVTRVQTAFGDDERIAIFSDYDCDGIPGGVVLHDFFTAAGHTNFTNYIPHRHHEGFGLSAAAVDKLHADKVSLIITIDCGTASVEAVERANELGIDVIITDHHEPGDVLPKALAIVNPKIGDSYPFPGLCGAGVIYKFIQAMLEKDRYGIAEGQEKWWLDLVGLATIADMVPLVDENRVFAHYGLLVLRKSRRPGLQQLLRKARANQRYLTEDDIGFTIGPRINAASRMDTPEDAFAMLATTDEGEAGARVAHLEKLNTERKSMVATMTKEIHKRMHNVTDVPSVIVLGNPEWRPSLVGLSANTLAEEYGRPVFLWGRDGNGVIKGSCRSDGVASVVRIMEAAAASLLEYGGHHASGGFSVSEDAIHHLPEALCAAYEAVGTEPVPELTEKTIDFDISLDDISSALLKDLDTLAPYGMSNPKPLFRITDVIPKEVTIFGKTKNHTKLTFDTAGRVREAIAFFKTPDQFPATPDTTTTCTLIGHIETSYFMGRQQTRLRIVDIV